MTDPSVVAAALVTVIVATVSGTVTIINAWAAARDRRDSKVQRAAIVATGMSTDKKADTLLSKADQIHSITNGTFSKAQSDLQVALAKMAGMATHIAGLETIIATLLRANDDRAAAERATADRKHRASDTPGGDPVRVEVTNTPLAVTTAQGAQRDPQ